MYRKIARILRLLLAALRFVLAALPLLLAALAAPGIARAQLPPTPRVTLAVNPLTDKVYTANPQDNTVSAFDASRGTSTTIPVGNGPEFIAVNPATNRVYVDNATDATLTVIDGATDSVIGTYGIGASGPISIDPLSDIVYVVRLTGTGSDEVTFFDDASAAWYTIATGSFQPNAMAVNPATHTIYVAHYATGDVRVISGAFDPANDFPASTSIGVFSHPYAIAANPVTNKVYVITQDANGPIAVIDGSDNTAAFPAIASGHASGPQAIVVNPVTNKAYAAFANEVIVIDGATDALAYVPIEGASSGAIALGIDYSTDRIYAATSLGTLNVIDGDADTVVSTQSIAAGVTSLGVNPLTHTLYLDGSALDSYTDTAGTAHSIALTTTIDPLPGDSSTGTGSITLDASNGFSPTALPVRSVYFRMDGLDGAWMAAQGGGPYTASFTGLAPGSHTLYAFAADGQDAPLATGPQSVPLLGAVASYTFTVPDPKVDPSVSLASSANPSLSGENVTFMAGVAGSNGTATGSVDFLDGTAALCSGVALANGAAGCTTGTLAVGSHSITAHYSGDASYRTATSSPLPQTVQPPKVSSTASLASSANPSTLGQGVTFTVTLSGSSGTPTGTVTFTDGSTNLCSAVALSGSGSADCTAASLGAGTHSISASYSGDAAYNAATSNTVTQTVQSPPSQFTLSVSLSGSGTVTSSPAGIDCGATCSASFASGSLVSLSAAAASGSTFAGWSGGGCSGTSTCTVTMNAATSVTATFSANANPERLGNISTRGMVLTGNDVMIGGFIIGGSTNKTVAIVATGPSLSAYGISNPLMNPTLTLVRQSDSTVIATNDDWQSDANASQLQASGFAPPDPHEAALYVTLPPGAYTAIVQGVGGTTGVAVIGVFEVDHPEIPLINISTRGLVQTGNNVMIGGFILNGTSPQKVAIVATGPSLSAYGVPNPLPNPQITIVRSSDQSVVATNDDWQSDPNAAQLQASGFAPSDSRESGLLLTLPPGAYTAIVSGVSGTTGVAVVGVLQSKAPPVRSPRSKAQTLGVVGRTRHPRSYTSIQARPTKGRVGADRPFERAPQRCRHSSSRLSESGRRPSNSATRSFSCVRPTPPSSDCSHSSPSPSRRPSPPTPSPRRERWSSSRSPASRAATTMPSP